MNDPSNRDIAVFTEAVGLPPGERGAYLDGACAGDAKLRDRVEALLVAHGKAGDFLDTPAHEPVGNVSGGAAPEQPGDRIGHYKLLEQIGEGGCGVVFMAEQMEPVRRLVALKVIKPGMDTKSVIARFEAERQALALMDHPGIAKVFDAGTTDSGRPYFVMELVRGAKITDYCDQHSLTTDARLELFVQVCHAVQHAHQKGIIHRDIKPSNILVTTTEEGTPLPKVIDFGIAKATTGQRLTDKTLFTAFEMLIGTPAYMSPEQADMTSVDVDTRSDVYSLGVLLYEMLTGATPFDTKELLKAGLDEVRRVIREQEPFRPSTRLSKLTEANLTDVAGHRSVEPPALIRKVRGDLDWIVMKALEKDRTRRYETASGLALDVQRFLGNEVISARQPGAWYKLKKVTSRHKLLFSLFGVIAALLITGLAVVTMLLANESRAHQDAEHARNQAEADKRKAQAEAAKSREVTWFLQDMLESAGPTAALGRDTGILRDILERADERITRELTNQPDVEADLRYSIGQVYEDLGAYAEAGRMFRRVLELNRRFLPETSPETAVTLGRVARVLLHQQQVEEAERNVESAIAIWRRLGDEQSLNYSVTLETLAMVRWKQDRLEEAEALMLRVVELRRELVSEEGREYHDALNNLGNVVFTAKRYPEAEQLFRETLEAKGKRYGEAHPSIAHALQSLGVVLSEQRKDAEAEACLSRAVAMRRRLLGEAHPGFAASLMSLAAVLLRSQSYAAAESLYREALAIERKRLETHAPEVLHAGRCLVRALAPQRKNREVVSLLSEFLTPEFMKSEESASMLALRAEALASQGLWKEAARDASLAVAHEPANHEHCHTLAPLLIAIGDKEAYRRLCGQIINRFHNTTSVSTADRMAKDCLIDPAAGVDLRLVAALADLAVTKGADRPALPLYQVCKSLADYRQRNFVGAIEWAEKAAACSYPYAAAGACSVLAMALHLSSQPEAARAALARCVEIVERKLPAPGSADLGADWRDWIICRSLLEEARNLLEGAAQENSNRTDQ